MKKKRNKIILILLSVITITLPAQEIWTLEKCIERAVKKNISIKQTELDLKIIKENKKTAISRFIPNINLGGSHSWNVGLNQNITTGVLENMTTSSASINANIGLDLFTGLQNIQQLYKANLNVLASQYQLDDMKEDISLMVANAYLQILFNKENLTVQESQLEIANKELFIAQERLNTGVIPKGDVIEIEAKVANMEQNVLIAENNYRISRIALAQLLLIPDYENFEIAEERYDLPNNEILNQDINSIYNIALSNRNDIKLAQTNLKIAKKDLAIAKSTLLPQVSGFYSFNSRVLFDEQNSFIDQLDANAGEIFGIQISIPIFNQMSVQTNIKQNKLNIKKAEYAIKQMELDLENTILQAYTDAKGSLKTYEAAEKTLSARKLAYEYAKERFDNGAMNTFNFLQAQQRYESAQSELIRTKYDYIFKLNVLKFYFATPNFMNKDSS